MFKKILIVILLVSLPAVGQTQVSIKRAKELLISIEMAAGIKYLPLTIDSDSEINAYSDHNGIYITNGMLKYLNNDAELAMILGHEVAHYKFGDYRRDGSYFQEYRADQYGAIYAEKMGYNHCTTSKILYRFYKTFGNGDTGGVHPRNLDRYERVHHGC